MERKVIYFDNAGKENTKACLEVVKNILKQSNIKDVVIASTTGETGMIFAEALKEENINLVIVTHSYGFVEPNHTEVPPDKKKMILSTGAKVYTGTMVTHTLETALAKKFSGLYPTLIVAQTLRRFGEGVKVCCEIVMMAADAGLIPEGVEVVAVAGTMSGADTVMIIKSATSKRFLDLQILEILAKPRSLK